ncbi:hypothetical protein IOC57_09385 [Bacillus sp. SD075]|uniref:hypothetical protein n=1 Tax=Bacillus sp. SD075 TaxID=2781732 RepID=UPI001A95F34A|nr:hypothetical protein [Bacillus sp. SD075]MBO0997959.1 hypothetical protein [Bacillus sp. SD075]
MDKIPNLLYSVDELLLNNHYGQYLTYQTGLVIGENNHSDGPLFSGVKKVHQYVNLSLHH